MNCSKDGWLVLVVVWMTGTFGCQTEDQAEFPPVRMEFETNRLNSSATCGTCHEDIFSAWKNSSHALSVSNANFQEALRETTEMGGEDASRPCLTCHAPGIMVTEDVNLSDPVVQEGINCDFCHSLKGTRLDKPEEPFVLEVSSVKLGPVPDASSTGHDVAYSEFHTSSLHCAGCHEYRNRNGVEILSTYSEWQEYEEAGGDQTCQGCHMPLILANVVDPKIKRVEGSFVNLHVMPGGHSKDQLAKSTRLKIMEVRKSQDQLYVSVQLQNVGAGHRVPTGSPSRKVVLGLEVLAEGSALTRQERIFQRVTVDTDQQPIRTDARIFLQAASIQSDNRLAPGEKRLEEFQIQIPKDKNIEIEATLTYVHSPHDRTETETRIDFFSEKRSLLSSWTR